MQCICKEGVSIHNYKVVNMVDLKNKYVRIMNVRDDKYIEFDFSIEDPEVFVELILPFEMFQTFCEKNQVKYLESTKVIEEKYKQQIWRMGHSRKNVFRK